MLSTFGGMKNHHLEPMTIEMEKLVFLEDLERFESGLSDCF